MGRCSLDARGQMRCGGGGVSTLVLTVAACCLLSHFVGASPVKPVRRVPFINSLGPSYLFTARVSEAINMVLEKLPYQIELYHEYLERILFPNEPTLQEFRDWYISKHRDRKPHVIVAVGLDALRFMGNSLETGWRALRGGGFRGSLLPPGGSALYGQPTVWETYKQYIIGFVFFCLVEALLIFGLLWQRAKRRKVEQSLFERLTFETLVSDLSTTFIMLPESQVGAHMEKSLGRIAEFLEMNRITIFEISREQPELIVTSAWHSAAVQPVPMVVKTDDYPWWTTLILRGAVVLVSDLNDLPEEASAEKEYLRRIGAVSTATVPLRAGDESFGCISFLSTTHRVLWTEELVKQLKILSEIFSNALMRRRAQEALQRLSGKLIDAQEKERSRIARDLHDDICQRLTLLALEIEHAMEHSGGIPPPADRLQEAREHCFEIAGDVQALSHELHSSMLDILGLTAAMKNYCREFSQQHDVVVECAHANVPDSLPRDVSLCLFRVVQEALHNAAKHSTANFFEVHLRGTPEGIELEVHDAGIGFDVESMQKKGGLGLISMQERIHNLKGIFAIDSKAKYGTTIRATVPLFASMGTAPAASKNVNVEVGEMAWRCSSQIVHTGHRDV